MENIWKLKDSNDFVAAMMEHLEQKTNYGENIAGLSKPERVFYITQTLEMEVNNGGFAQFFHNSSGAFSNELTAAFGEIGAQTTACICKKAIDALGQDIPVDREKREEMLDRIETDKIDEILDACDNAFYDYEDDLNTLNHAFCLKNRQFFN